MGDISKLQDVVLSDSIEEFILKLKSVSDVRTTWGSGINVIHYLVRAANDRTYDFGYAIDVLVNAGIDINAQNKKGESPLHICVHKKQLKLLKILILKGAKVDIQNVRGSTVCP